MTTHSKNYASAANAKRAAESYYKGLGIANPAEGEHYGIEPAGEGRFGWKPLVRDLTVGADSKGKGAGKPEAPAKGKDKAPTADKPKGDQPKKNGPVARVWAMCESMPGASRKEVVEACVAAGINVHTAKTQYQRWFSAQKNA